MTFAKLIESTHIVRAPHDGISDGRYHTDLPRFYQKHPDKAAVDGFFELVKTDKPEGYYEPRYTKDGAKIYQTWEPFTPPEPEPDPLVEQVEQTASVVDYNIMMGTLADPSEMEE